MQKSGLVFAATLLPDMAGNLTALLSHNKILLDTIMATIMVTILILSDI